MPKTRLGQALAEAETEYVHLRGLGNPKDDRAPFREGRLAEGRAKFRAVMRSDEARSDLDRLAVHARQSRVAVLWPASEAALADQLDLLEQDLNGLERVPLEFRCVDDDCPGRDMGLKDWEAGESYRKFLHKYGESEVRDKLRELWFDRMFTTDKAVRCFVGISRTAFFPMKVGVVGHGSPTLAALFLAIGSLIRLTQG